MTAKPHRKVTLLFDLPSQSSDELQHLYKQLEPLLEQLRPLLHQEPTEVKPMERHRECAECGSLMKPHAGLVSTQPLSLMYRHRDGAWCFTLFSLTPQI